MSAPSEPYEPVPEEVLPGLWTFPVVIPNNPLRYVLVYAFEVDGGLVLVDLGWNAPESFADFEKGLSAIGAGISDVKGVAVTHIHPDHYGLAGRVREESGAWIGLHPADANLIRDRYEAMDGLLDRMGTWAEDAGAPRSHIEALRSASLPVRGFVTPVKPDVLIEDGDRPIPGWDVVAVHTPGHSPGHLCFLDETRRVILTGDHVLPTITPNVSSNPQSGPDPLGDYLASLEKMVSYGDIPAFPAHQWRLPSVAARAQELLDHHEHRLDGMVEAFRSGAETIWDVAKVQKWYIPWDKMEPFMQRAALGETSAHLTVLERRGRIRQVGVKPATWRAV